MTGKIALGGADHGDVEVVIRLAIDLGRLGGLGRLRERLGARLHLEVHPDLEQLQGGQLPDRLGSGELAEHLEGLLKPEWRIRLGGDREPDVELVVAQVVVAHAGVGVDHVGGAPRVVGVNLGGDEHRGVAECARVEDRRDLTDDPLVDQASNATQDLVLADAGLLGDVAVGPGRDREGALHQVEQALVEIVKRNGGAVLATAELGTEAATWAGGIAYCSHRAASFA